MQRCRLVLISLLVCVDTLASNQGKTDAASCVPTQYLLQANTPTPTYTTTITPTIFETSPAQTHTRPASTLKILAVCASHTRMTIAAALR